MRVGYKLTEVGVIPEDWNNTSLCELVDQNRKITYGIVVPGPAIYDGVPLIRAQDYSKGWVDLEDLYRVSHTIDKAYKRSKVITGDVLLTIVGSVGNIAKVPQTFDDSNITQQTARLSFNPEVADADYYLNVLLSDVGRKAIANFTKSGVQPSLNLSDVEKFILPLPPLTEQRAIAQALSDVDALLTTLDQMIAKKRDLKQAAMQQLLTGKTRLPGFGGEWEISTLGQICSFENGDRSSNYPSPESFRQSGIPFINAGHIAGGNISTNEMNYITQEAYDRLGGGKVKAGDILFCLRGSLGKFGLVSSNFGYGAIASSLVIIRPKGAVVSREYLLCYFSSTLCAQMIETWSGGAAQPNLGGKELARFIIQLPPIPEQTATAKILTDMDAELSALETRRDKTRNIKQAMMQELLTGKTRLIAKEKSHASATPL